MKVENGDTPATVDAFVANSCDNLTLGNLHPF